MTLQELEKEESELSKLLFRNREKQREIRTNEFLSKYGVNIGDTIEYMDGKEKIVGVIDRITYSGVEANTLYIKQLNSDGKVGKRERRLWSWNYETIKKLEP